MHDEEKINYEFEHTFANEEFYKLASDKDYDCDIAARNSQKQVNAVNWDFMTEEVALAKTAPSSTEMKPQAHTINKGMCCTDLTQQKF